MFCPNCKYTTFDHYNVCPKCNFAWNDIKKALGIDWITEPHTTAYDIYKNRDEVKEEDYFFAQPEKFVEQEQNIEYITDEKNKKDDIEIDASLFLEEVQESNTDQMVDNKFSHIEETKLMNKDVDKELDEVDEIISVTDEIINEDLTVGKKEKDNILDDELVLEIDDFHDTELKQEQINKIEGKGNSTEDVLELEIEDLEPEDNKEEKNRFHSTHT